VVNRGSSCRFPELAKGEVGRLLSIYTPEGRKGDCTFPSRLLFSSIYAEGGRGGGSPSTAFSHGKKKGKANPPADYWEHRCPRGVWIEERWRAWTATKMRPRLAWTGQSFE